MRHILSGATAVASYVCSSRSYRRMPRSKSLHWCSIEIEHHPLSNSLSASSYEFPNHTSKQERPQKLGLSVARPERLELPTF